MARTKTVQYLVDEKGRKTSVLMSYKAYRQLMEDLADIRVIDERHDEPTRSLEDIVAELKDAGRL